MQRLDLAAIFDQRRNAGGVNMGWGEWGDLPEYCTAESTCEPDGGLMFCVNTVHEANCETCRKGTLLARSIGNLLGTGGSCTAELVFTSEEVLPSQFRLSIELELNGQCATTDGVVGSISIYVEVSDLNIDDKIYCQDVCKTSESSLDWDSVTLSLNTPVHEITVPGTYTVNIRVVGAATAALTEAFSSVDFSDKYNNGFYVKYNKCTVLSY